MEPQSKKSKKIDISSSSLVALKAELLNKQNEVRRAKSTTDGTSGSIKKGLPGIRKSEKVTAEIRNKGVENRAKMDEEQHEQETPSLDRARQVLEEKAKLYEKLSKDRSLLEEETISEEQTHFLVDFQQKVVENVRLEVSKQRSVTTKKEESDDEMPGKEEDYQAQSDGEEWVDFVDSFGRTRRCQKKDLPEFRERDRQVDPNRATYANFVKANAGESETADDSVMEAAEAERKQKRQQWEQEEEMNRSKSSLHYQDVLFQEARQHGAGYYAFARDEEVRAEQMSQLERMRQQTEAARSQQAAASAKKQSALQARLLKVKQRKRAKLGLPPLDEKEALAAIGAQAEPEPIGPPAPPQEPAQEEAPKTRPPSLPQSVRIRPWDLGKEGVPKSQPVLAQSSWVEKKREERVAEFAPPPAYSGSSQSPPVRNRPPGRVPRKEAMQGATSGEESPPAAKILTEDSILAGLAFIKQQTSNEPSEPSPERPVPGCDLSEEEEQAESSSSQAPRWRPKPSRTQVSEHRRGAEVPPPPCMDYYVGASTSKRAPSSKGASDLSQSMQMGMQPAGSRPSHSSSESTVNQRWNFYGS